MIYSQDLIKKAYKKLKCSVYFDKTQLLLRQQIVQFEDKNIDEKLNKIFVTLESGGAEWEQMEKEILDSISYKVFAKSLEKPEKTGETEKKKATFISNYVPEETKVEKVQYYINMMIEGHVFGVLWLLSVGWMLDESLYDKSYGNRLREHIIRELEDERDISFSPYLFEPYFRQYESWRDSALEMAQNSINKDQDVVVFTMDFERFFYSVDLNESVFEKIDEIIAEAYKKDGVDILTLIEKTIAKRLNSFVKNVINKYSDLFDDEFDGRKLLPIGFLPSNVLGNWCLQKFDKAVVDGWNPLYFGRYVDDIIIVDKIEKNSDLYNSMSDGKLDAEMILKYFLTQCSRWNGFPGEDICSSNRYALFRPSENEKEGMQKKKYILNSKYNITPDTNSKISLQNTKVKVFYFRHGESSAILQCFRNQITHNKSEFRFLPEDEAVFDANDYSEIYDIDNKESINKLRGVDGISIDKFDLSKLLGKYMRISGLINDKVETNFARDITKIYDNHVIIDNCTTWEKVIDIFVVNGQWKALGAFIGKIASALEKIKYVPEGRVIDEFVLKRENNMRTSMREYLYAAWVRALALVWGSETDRHIEQFGKKFGKLPEEIAADRRSYLLTRMYDKYTVPVFLDALGREWMEKVSDKCPVCLYDFNAVLENAVEEDTGYIYYPYMVTMYDLYIMKLAGSGLRQSENLQKTEKKWDIQSVREQYVRINYGIQNFDTGEAIYIKEPEIFSGKAQVISVGTEKQDKLKIAIANIELNHKNFEKLVKGSPNRSYARYKGLSHIINSAIAEKADMLVLPESSIPIEWLATVARTCAKNHMAMIAGIEHIVYRGKVYNYTAVILPYEEEGSNCAVLSLHLKNHYAPQELEEIHGYRLKEVCGSGYELYHWRDCWFPVYCCYELASIVDRALFSSYADMLVAVEWNKDINYYSNILESLSRDLHCYCVQVNSSDYGDSRITMPSKTEIKDIVKTKGGSNETVLVGTVDIGKLREFQFKEYNLQKTDRVYKPTPPLFNKEIVERKIRGTMRDCWEEKKN